MPYPFQPRGLTPPSPVSASPTAGINPKTLEQLLGIFKQTMSKPRQAPRPIPPARMPQRVPDPSARQRLQQYRGT